MGKHTIGGIVTQVKQPKTLTFKSLREAISSPDTAGVLMSDFAKFDRPLQIHFGVQALHMYAAESGGTFPAPSDTAACAKVLADATKLASDAGCEVEFSPRLLSNLSSGSRGEMSPLCAFFGGIVGQEVMKAASGKFCPIQQWLYFDAEEALPGNGEKLLAPTETAPRNSRYDGQAAVLGWSLQERLASLNYLLVGAGAIGCEMLKNFAMMGVACGPNGTRVAWRACVHTLQQPRPSLIPHHSPPSLRSPFPSLPAALHRHHHRHRPGHDREVQPK